jgi:hypothetical protein
MAGSSKPAPRKATPVSATNKKPGAPAAFNQTTSNPTSDADASVSFTPTPNVVGNYYQPTYYFRWYLLSEFADPADESTASGGLTIAETGATGLNLQNVEIEAYIGPNSQSRNANATNITMTIVEPLGANLPNVLYRAASDLQIYNYHKAPWMLEVKLLGYDSVGNRQVIKGNTWRWQMMLLNIDTKISESGSVHTVTALPLEELALDNQYCMLTEAFSVSGKEKSGEIGDVLADLADRLTHAADIRYGKGFLKYSFEDRPYAGDTYDSNIPSPFKHKIVADKPQDHDERNQGIGQFSPGTDIPHIVDALMSTSSTALAQARLSRKELTFDNSKTGLDPEEDIANMKPFSVMHRIDTKVKIVGWNPVVQDYCREITYIVRPYATVRLITNHKNAAVFTSDIAFQKKKANYVIGQSFLTKAYDYVFTGTNTEVYKFDMTLNFNWAIAVPMLGGTIHYGSTTIPRHLDDDYLKQQEVWHTLEQGRSDADSLQQRLNVLEQGGLDAKDPNAQGAQQAIDDLRNALKDLESKNAQNQTDAIQSEQKKIDSRKAQVAKVVGYAEKLEEESSTAPKTLPVMPVTITSDADKPNASSDFGVSSQWHQGRSIYGSLLNQMYGAVDGNLMNIDLQVRGDPYWLGPPGYQTVARDVGKSSGEAGNWMNGEHMFVFRFKVPQGYNSLTGGVKTSPYNLGDTDVYSGFYTAIKVTHKFEGGQFSQILTATRVPGWEISKVLGISGDAPAKGNGGK